MLYSPQAAQIIAKSQAQEYSAQIERNRVLAEMRQTAGYPGLVRRIVGQFRRNR